jgi:DNA invertase Pin-like site-specific DNA recombinase
MECDEMSARTADQDITWGAYARLSRVKSSQRKRHGDRYGKPAASTVRQVRLIKEFAAERGLDLPGDLIYVDPGRSAWKEDGERPEWDNMMAAGQAGRFGGLLTWKLDRFSRNILDGEALLRLGVLLDGPSSGRIDLRTAHGKSTFRKQIEAATNYSDETSEKVKAAFDDMLRDGYRIGGSGRMFGFEIAPDGLYEYDEDEDRIAGPAAVVRAEEAEVVRELAGRLLDGDTSEAMAGWLNERGITTTRGGRWTPRNLSRTLANPIYGGWVTYKGERRSRLAEVEPILDEQTFDAVQAKLGARRRGRRVTGRYPLSGVLVCGNPACGRRGTMAGYPRSSGQLAYICARANGGCGMSVAAAPVEQLVRDAVVSRLADVELREAARAADAWLDEQRAKLRGLLDDLDADMADIEAKRAATPRGMTRLRDQYDRNTATLRARYEATGRQLDELGTAPAPADPLPAITAGEWDDAEVTPAAVKAATIRRLGLRITVVPGTRPQGASRLPFDTSRVRIGG